MKPNSARAEMLKHDQRLDKTGYFVRPRDLISRFVRAHHPPGGVSASTYVIAERMSFAALNPHSRPLKVGKNPLNKIEFRSPIFLLAALALLGANPARAADAKAIKIIFKQNFPSGSFDAPPPSGTAPAPGFGLAATRIFSPNGSLIASGDVSASTWPKWLTRFEIGISGSSNTSAVNAACAKFADTTESSTTDNCNFTTGSGTTGAIGCGAPNGLFRVSEFDCLQNTINDGNGGPSDGVYFRAIFDRSKLGSKENIQMIVEYVASAYNQAPALPKNCFVNGQVAPENCSDLTWKIYLKHTVSEIVQPLLPIIPPTQNFVNTGLSSSGASPQARQIILPIASDANLTVMQMSRIRSNLNVNNSSVQNACRASGTLPANSPLCTGLIINSISFYRM